MAASPGERRLRVSCDQGKSLMAYQLLDTGPAPDPSAGNGLNGSHPVKLLT